MEVEAEENLDDLVSPTDFERIYVKNIKLSDYGFRSEININKVLDDVIHQIMTVTKGKDQTLALEFDIFSTDWWEIILSKICSSDEIMSKIDDLDLQDTEFRFQDLADLFKLYSSSAKPKKWPHIHIDQTPSETDASEDLIKNLKEEIYSRPGETAKILWLLKDPEGLNGMEKGEAEEEAEDRMIELKMIEFAKLVYFDENPFIQEQLAAMKTL